MANTTRITTEAVPATLARPGAIGLLSRVTTADLAALALLLLAALTLSVNLTGALLTDDEESYLYAAWRVSLGELPYRDFLTPQLPVFLGLGGLVMRLAGPEVWPVRLLSVVAVVLTGALVYGLGRRLFRPAVALGALALFLTYPQVVDLARVYRPEALMLLAQVAALTVFILAWERGSQVGLALSGVLFGLAILTKLFGALPLAGALAFLGWQALRGRQTWRAALADGLAVGLAALGTVTLVMGVFLLITPTTYTAVLGHHLMQGAGQSQSEVATKGLAFLLDWADAYAPILLLALAGVWIAPRDGPASRAALVWQLPTAVVFLFLSRDLFHRHLVYLAPTLCLLASAALAPLWTRERGARGTRLLAVAVLAGLIAPSLDGLRDALTHRDDATWRVVALLDAVVPPGAPFLTDNSGLNFYTRRPTMPSAASLSRGATESGQITAAQLIQEMEGRGFDWTLTQTAGPGKTLMRTGDASLLSQMWQRDFEEVGEVQRDKLSYKLLHRKGTPLPPTFDLGRLRVMALRVDHGEIDLAWQPQDGLDRRARVELQLVDGQEHAISTRPLDLEGLSGRPLKDWPVGIIQVTRVDVSLARGEAPGEYAVRLRLLSESGQVQGEAVVGRVQVDK